MFRHKGSIFTIPAEQSFLDSLASQMIIETEGDLSQFSETIVLLPTRRACRALQDSFLRLREGVPTALPAMQAIGDVDEEELAFDNITGIDIAELAPAMPDSYRILSLAKRIQSHRISLPEVSPHVSPPDQALLLAIELARFLDMVQTERLDFAGLDALVPEELAMHWQETLGFLRDFTENWPSEVERLGFLEPAERRNRLLDARVQQWGSNPPAGPIIAAGSTGSIPVTADLLAMVARMPQGRVILPGLDLLSDETNWAAISKDPTHPQFGMARLLKRLKVKREDVAVWGHQSICDRRARLILEAMRPAPMTAVWQNLEKSEPLPTDGLHLIECSNESEEAGVIALILRKQLEVEGKTGALVTGDRRLARRVAMELKRWKINIDDSAGIPLADTYPAIFMRLVAEMVAEQFGPVALLGLGKHPLTAAGFTVAGLRSGIRLMDRTILRGPRSAPGIQGIRSLLETTESKSLDASSKSLLANILDEFDIRCRPMSSLRDGKVPFSALVEAHIKVAEALAQTEDRGGAERLWVGESGESLARFFSDLRVSASVFSDLSLYHYPAVLNILMRRTIVRPRYGMHPRLNVWGPLEARLQKADCIIVAGLNEGNWPLEVKPDPWLSRPMRRSFGLPVAEQRIGLSAHDFTQLLAAPEVFLTRSRKVDGTPTVPTRWLSRLNSVLRAAGNSSGLIAPDHWTHWQTRLDRPKFIKPVGPPVPRPPISARPEKLSVTQIETLMRDPYGIYARHIINLKKLEPLEADPGASQNGMIIHVILDRYISRFSDGPPPADLQVLLKIGEEVFGEHPMRPSVYAFWWPRFCRIAEWFVVEYERVRVNGVIKSFTEIQGSINLETKNGPFELTARADRIDQFADGRLEIIDYKTGSTPTKKQVQNGLSPQLPLEALIASNGGFEGLKGQDIWEVFAFYYWKLGGGHPAGTTTSFDNLETLIEEAFVGVQTLVEKFSDPATAYEAIPVPSRKPHYNDYEHLERILEWSGGTKK